MCLRKQLTLIIDDETNLGNDLTRLIVSFDMVDFKSLKLDLANAMKDRIDRKLEYKKCDISTIIHGIVYYITFDTYYESPSLITKITYNGSDFDNNDEYYPRKSLHKLTKEEFIKFC